MASAKITTGLKKIFTTFKSKFRQLFFELSDNEDFGDDKLELKTNFPPNNELGQHYDAPSMYHNNKSMKNYIPHNRYDKKSEKSRLNQSQRDNSTRKQKDSCSDSISSIEKIPLTIKNNRSQSLVKTSLNQNKILDNKKDTFRKIYILNNIPLIKITNFILKKKYRTLHKELKQSESAFKPLSKNTSIVDLDAKKIISFIEINNNNNQIAKPSKEESIELFLLKNKRRSESTNIVSKCHKKTLVEISNSNSRIDTEHSTKLNRTSNLIDDKNQLNQSLQELRKDIFLKRKEDKEYFDSLKIKPFPNLKSRDEINEEKNKIQTIYNVLKIPNTISKEKRFNRRALTVESNTLSLFRLVRNKPEQIITSTNVSFTPKNNSQGTIYRDSEKNMDNTIPEGVFENKSKNINTEKSNDHCKINFQAPKQTSSIFSFQTKLEKDDDSKIETKESIINQNKNELLNAKLEYFGEDKKNVVQFDSKLQQNINDSQKFNLKECSNLNKNDGKLTLNENNTNLENINPKFSFGPPSIKKLNLEFPIINVPIDRINFSFKNSDESNNKEKNEIVADNLNEIKRDEKIEIKTIEKKDLKNNCENNEMQIIEESEIKPFQQKSQDNQISIIPFGQSDTNSLLNSSNPFVLKSIQPINDKIDIENPFSSPAVSFSKRKQLDDQYKTKADIPNFGGMGKLSSNTLESNLFQNNQNKSIYDQKSIQNIFNMNNNHNNLNNQLSNVNSSSTMNSLNLFSNITQPSQINSDIPTIFNNPQTYGNISNSFLSANSVDTNKKSSSISKFTMGKK